MISLTRASTLGLPCQRIQALQTPGATHKAIHLMMKICVKKNNRLLACSLSTLTSHRFNRCLIRANHTLSRRFQSSILSTIMRVTTNWSRKALKKCTRNLHRVMRLIKRSKRNQSSRCLRKKKTRASSQWKRSHRRRETQLMQ